MSGRFGIAAEQESPRFAEKNKKAANTTLFFLTTTAPVAITVAPPVAITALFIKSKVVIELDERSFRHCRRTERLRRSPP